MSGVRSAGEYPQAEIDHVTVEMVAWVTNLVGGDGSRRKMFDEAISPGATVRTVLQGLSDRYPTLRDVLWDPASHDLSDHIQILVNDAFMDVTHGLDSPVRGGERITLLAQYAGG